MKEEQVVKEALEKIDQGFDALEKDVQDPSMEYRYLLASTNKAVRFAEGIIELCKKDLTDEALPVLRSLVEHTLNIRWITSAHTPERFKEYMTDLEHGSFSGKWTDKSLDERIKEIDPKDREYFDVYLKFTYAYAHVNASSLGWDEVMDDPTVTGIRFKPQAIYVIVAQMLGHVMKALDHQFPGYFSDYAEIWGQVSIDPQIGKKFKQLRKSAKATPN